MASSQFTFLRLWQFRQLMPLSVDVPQPGWQARQLLSSIPLAEMQKLFNDIAALPYLASSPVGAACQVQWIVLRNWTSASEWQDRQASVISCPDVKACFRAGCLA